MSKHRPVTRVALFVAMTLAGCAPAAAPASDPAAASGSAAGGPAASSVEAASGFGADYFTAASSPLNLAITVDRGKAATGRIATTGGSVSATGTDGTTYVLDVPAGALAADTDVTLSPISAATGWPQAPGNLAAVEMHPDGLTFAKPGRLVITPPGGLGDSVGMPFRFYADGKDAHLILPERGASGIVIPVEHFSGHGFVWNVNESFWLTLERYRQDSAEDRVQHKMADEIGRARAQEKAGKVADPSINEIMEENKALVEREVLNRRLLLASKSCADAKRAVSAFLAWSRQVQLLGLQEQGRIDPPPNLRDLVRYVCAEEATKLCFETGDVERLVSVLLGDARELQIVGGDTGGKTAPYIEACARFDLVIDHHTEAVVSKTPRFAMEADIEVKVPLRWKPDDAMGITGTLEGEAPGEVTDSEGVAGPCAMTIGAATPTAPYEVKVQRVEFINTGPAATTIRLKDIELTLKEGHFTANGTIKCPRAPAAPFPALDMPFVFWANPPEKMTGWKAGGHPTIATKDFARTLNVGTTGTETIDMKLVHTPGPMPTRPELEAAPPLT